MLSTLLPRAPKSSVQVCAKAVDWCGKVVWVKLCVFRTAKLTTKGPMENHRLIRDLYTFCVQKFTGSVGNFTSVNYGFYTVYTGPITTTTTYINNKEGVL